MNQNEHEEIVQRIADNISQEGYQVTVAPSRIPNRRMWQFDPPYLFRGLKHKPDLLVQRGDQFAVVKVRTRPFLMGGVAHARDLSKYFGAPAIVCVPDEMLQEIPKSVLRFADEAEVGLSPMSSLPAMLSAVLQKYPT